MATGVSGSYSQYSSTYVIARISYSETYSVANNSSDVTVSLHYRRTNTYHYPTYAPGTYYVNINGTNYAVYTGTFTIPADNNEWQFVGSKKVTGIGHNSDGSKTIKIGGSFTSTVSGSYMNFSILENTALTTIPRASTSSVSPNPLTLSSANNTLAVTTNRADSSFTHTVKCICGTWDETQTGVGASTTFDIPQTIISQMTGTQMNCSVETTTYNGSTQIGSKTTTAFKVQVDTTQEHPVIGTVTLSDTNAETAAVEAQGSFIKNASNLQAVIALSVAGSYTTLASAQVSIDGVTSTYPLSGTTASITFTKNKVVGSVLVINVTDNRGYTVSLSKTLTIIPYEPVAFVTASTRRTNSSGNPSDTGEYISYDVEVKCFYGTFGLTDNTLTLYYQSKLATDSTYSAFVQTATASASGQGTVTTYTFHGITLGGFSSALEYDLIFKVTDIFSSATFPSIRIHEGLPIAGWGRDHFDIYGDFHIHNRSDATQYISLDANNPEEIEVTFSGAVGQKVTWNVFKFGNLRMATCQWMCSSNHAINSAWGSMASSAQVNTPDYPVSFANVIYANCEYMSADSNSEYDAFVMHDVVNTISLTNYGQIYLVRPSSGSTVGHPTFSQIVIGTV